MTLINFRLAWLLSALVVFLSGDLAGKRLQRESVYSAEWCSAREGKQEVRTGYGTRADCVFRDADGLYAVEVDFADKWYEGIGQALHYGTELNAWPGLVLIVEEKRDCHYLSRVRGTLEGVRSNGKPIRLWLTGPAADVCDEDFP